MNDRDFEMRIARGYSLVAVNVLYWMPDYRNILNEFVWQTMDLAPRYPRIEQFLAHWRREIDAVISEVRILDAGVCVKPVEWRTAKLWQMH